MSSSTNSAPSTPSPATAGPSNSLGEPSTPATCSPAWCGDRPEARSVIELDVGTDAPGVAIAITVTDTAAPGFVTVGACDAFDDVDRIATSNVNYLAGQTVTNLALVDLHDGTLCLYTLASAQIIVDVQAELTEAHDAGLTPMTPTRVHDSRD